MDKNTFLNKWEGFKDLPGIAAHQLLMPSSRPFTREQAKDIDKYRFSAVGIVCYPDENEEIRLLLIERPEYDGAHSGQMAFPGGKVDPSDESILAAAT